MTSDEVTQRQIVRVRQLLGEIEKDISDKMILYYLREHYPSDTAAIIRRLWTGELR
jgi:hypothetical protein